MMGVIGLSRQHIGAWEVMPKWHPARLLGFDLWRYACEDPHCFCVYRQWGRSKKVARETLEKTYGKR